MNIVFLGQYDNGGVLSMYADVINKYTQHKANAIVGNDQYGHHSDIIIRGVKWGRDRERKPSQRIKTAFDILGGADVIVARDGDIKISNDLDWTDFVTGPIVNFYGDVQNTVHITRKCFTNQPQIHEQHSSIEFIPTAISNIEKIIEGTSLQDGKEIIVSHSTLDRYNKNTESFLLVMSYLMKNYNNINYDIIENCSYWETIMKKSLSNIGVDHIHEKNRYYGISSLENSALGLINITHLSDGDIKLIMGFFDMKCFLWETVSNEGELYRCVEKYIEDRDLLLEKRKETQQWFLSYWDNKRIAKKLIDFLL